jgi:uncharacterized protein
MDRLFLDANVLFSAVYKTESGLLLLWKLQDVALCTSRYALEEARINLAQEEQRERLMSLATALDFFDVVNRELPRGISLPEKDSPILLAAWEARARYLITGDLRHFGPYLGKKIRGTTIITPAEYFRIRNREGR